MQVPFLHCPKYLVLVRDLKASLVSHYERFKPDYNGISFSEYLRGDVRQKKFHSDIWTRMRFMNEWGRLMEKGPEKIRALRYEDLKADPKRALAGVCDFFGVQNVTDNILNNGVAACTKEKMARKPNPEITTTVVRAEARGPEDLFTSADEDFFRDRVARHLRHDFGYYLA